MEIQKPENDNYAATVVRVRHLVDLDNCDNVVALPLLGYQAIVSKDTEVDTLGVLFNFGSQLSLEYTKENNLFRHSELNKDTDKSGYIEDNRRVKAVKFRGHPSNALFMPLDSLAYTGINISELKEGDSFDTINGHEICQKYVVRQKGAPRVEKNKHKVFKRVDEKFLPEHYDSEQYFKNQHVIKGNKQIIVTQKLHGTSIRLGNTIVKRKHSLLEKIAKKLGVLVAETEFAHVYGSRKVIKDPYNPNQNHYYGVDLYSEEGKKYDDLIPENFIVYGELVGWTPEGAPIQKNYTYCVPQGQNDLYVYRVAMVSNQGILVDLSWEQVKEFCRDRGLKTVPELWVGKHKYFNAYDWLDKNFFRDGFKNAVPLEAKSPCDEGVCIRVDGIAPYILKAKSPVFFEHESKMADEGDVDIEELAKETSE